MYVYCMFVCSLVDFEHSEGELYGIYPVSFVPSTMSDT